MSSTLYDEVGAQFFVDLVEHFYEAVERDVDLRALYPEDLDPPKEHLTLFLVQYWGGPRTYQETRGHPRLRLRHVPFVITAEQRDAWLAAMDEALETSRSLLAPGRLEELRDYFDMAAHQLRNA